jgi:hypothetical protein
MRRGERVSASDQPAITGGDTLPFSTPPGQPSISARPARDAGARAGRDTAESIELPIKKKPVGLWLAMAGVALIVALAVVFSGGSETSAPAPAQVKPAPASEAVVTPEPTAATPPSALAPVHISASPPDALIEVDGVVLGNGQADVQRTAAARIRVTIRRSGYAPKSVELDAQSAAALHVSLDPAPAPATAPSVESGKSRPKPAASKRPAPAVEPAPAPTPAPRPRRGLNDVVDPWQ